MFLTMQIPKAKCVSVINYYEMMHSGCVALRESETQHAFLVWPVSDAMTIVFREIWKVLFYVWTNVSGFDSDSFSLFFLNWIFF